MSCHPNCSNHHESAGACSGQEQRRSRRDDGQAARMYATKGCMPGSTQCMLAGGATQRRAHYEALAATHRRPL